MHTETQEMVMKAVRVGRESREGIHGTSRRSGETIGRSLAAACWLLLSMVGGRLKVLVLLVLLLLLRLLVRLQRRGELRRFLLDDWILLLVLLLLLQLRLLLRRRVVHCLTMTVNLKMSSKSK